MFELVKPEGWKRFVWIFFRYKKSNQSQKQKQPPEGFYKKGALKKFHKVHLKTPVLESLFNRVPGLMPATLLKKRLQRRCFQVNFVKFLRTPFLQNTSVICLTVPFHKKVLYNCLNLLLLEKWTKLTILLSFHFANTFYTLYCECILYSLRASDGSFYPIFLRRFGYLLVTTSSYESGFSGSAATHMVE